MARGRKRDRERKKIIIMSRECRRDRIERQTDTQTGRHTDRQTDRHTDRQTERQTDRHEVRQTNR